MKSSTESSLLSAIRPTKGEKILEIDGTVTTQPVLEHVGISTWPGKFVKIYNYILQSIDTATGTKHDTNTCTHTLIII
jgi:hypothetical protein